MNNISKIQNKIVNADLTIISALKKMDEVKSKFLFVFDGDRFDCMLTIGDIQRAIIRNVEMSRSVSDILDRNKIYAKENDSIEDIKEVMFKEGIDCMPILNELKEILDVLFWADVFKETVTEVREKIDLPVVIMAGGKGTRLKPITNVIPKPLVPVGDKTILEVIMDQFEGIGCHKFYMSVNYKADMMKYYLSQLPHHYDIEFFMEDKPLGTIGSVSLIKGKITTPFFVSNCDSINDQDYRDVYEYHVNNHNDLTISLILSYIAFSVLTVLAGQFILHKVLQFDNSILLKESYFPCFGVLLLYVPVLFIDINWPTILRMIVIFVYLVVLIFFIGFSKSERNYIINLITKRNK